MAAGPAALLRALVVADTGGAEAKLAAFGHTVNATARTGSSAFSKFASVGKAAFIGVAGAAVAVGAVSIKAALDFDRAMTKVAALTGASTKELYGMRTALFALAKETGQSPKQLADALYYVESAGFRGKVAMDVLRQSAIAAANGMTDTKTVADAVTSAMNAYGPSTLSAKAATDILSAGVQQGKTEFGDFAGSLGKVIAIAHGLGVSFQDVVANMATLTRQGISSDQAATALKGTLIALAHPSAQAAEALAKMGLSSAGLLEELRTKGLLATLETLRDKTHNNVSELTKIIPGFRGLADILGTVSTQGANYEQILAAVNGSTKGAGITAAQWAITQKDVSVQLERLRATVQVLLIQLGEKLIPIIQHVVEWMLKHKGIVIALAVVIGVGLVGAITAWIASLIIANALTLGIVAVFAAVVAVAALLWTHFDKLSGAAKLLVIALALIFPPLGLILTLVEAIKHFHGIVDFIKGIATGFADLAGAWTRAFERIGAFIVDFPGKVARFFSDLWSKITGFFTGLPAAIGRWLDSTGSAVGRAFARMWDRALSAVRNGAGAVARFIKRWAFEAILAVLTLGLSLVVSLFINWGDNILRAVQRAFHAVVRFVTSVGRDIAHGVVQGFHSTIAFFAALPGRIARFFTGAGVWLLGAGRRLAGGLAHGITTGAVSTWNFLRALPGRIGRFFVTSGQWLFNSGRNITFGLARGLTAAYTAVAGFFTRLPGQIARFFVGAGRWLYNAGRDIVTGLAKGIGDFAGILWDAIKHLAGSILRGIKHWLHIGSPSKATMELGQWTMQGFIQGMEAERDNLRRLVGGVALDVTGGLRTAAVPTGVGARPIGVTRSAGTPAAPARPAVHETINFHKAMTGPEIINALRWERRTRR